MLVAVVVLVVEGLVVLGVPVLPMLVLDALVVVVAPLLANVARRRLVVSSAISLLVDTEIVPCEI